MANHVTVTSDPAFEKRYQAHVRPRLKQALPPMPNELLNMITAYVCHELASQPLRIDLGAMARLNAVTLGHTSGNRPELILSQVMKDRSSKVTRVTPSGTTGFNTTSFRASHLPDSHLFSVAREPTGIFHFVDLNDIWHSGHLREERGDGLIPIDDIPDPTYPIYVGWPDAIQTYDSYSGEMWRLTGTRQLMTYPFPKTGKPHALAQARKNFTLRQKGCGIQGLSGMPLEPLLVTPLPSERIVVVTQQGIELVNTVRGVSIAERKPPSRFKEQIFLPFTAATHTPDRTRFFAAAQKTSLTVFKIKDDRIFYQHIQRFPEYISAMKANSAAVAMTLESNVATHLLWDIETRQPIATVKDPSPDLHLHDVCWLTEGNILFTRGLCENYTRYSLVTYDFRTPHSQKSPVLSLVT